jgi:hypothetical protein
MKALSKLMLVSVVVTALLLPIATMSDQLPRPVQKTVLPSQGTIEYAGQTLRFTTDVPLKVFLAPLGADRIEIKVVAHPSQGGGNSPANTIVQIYWANWDDELYNGPPPWSAILLTESGFTEK